MDLANTLSRDLLLENANTCTRRQWHETRAAQCTDKGSWDENEKKNFRFATKVHSVRCDANDKSTSPHDIRLESTKLLCPISTKGMEGKNKELEHSEHTFFFSWASGNCVKPTLNNQFAYNHSYLSPFHLTTRAKQKLWVTLKTGQRVTQKAITIWKLKGQWVGCI